MHRRNRSHFRKLCSFKKSWHKNRINQCKKVSTCFAFLPLQNRIIACPKMLLKNFQKTLGHRTRIVRSLHSHRHRYTTRPLNENHIHSTTLRMPVHVISKRKVLSCVAKSMGFRKSRNCHFAKMKYIFGLSSSRAIEWCIFFLDLPQQGKTGSLLV